MDLGDGFSAVDGFHAQDFFLDVRGQEQEVHVLADAGARYPQKIRGVDAVAEPPSTMACSSL